MLPVVLPAFVAFPVCELDIPPVALDVLEFRKGFRVQFGGIGFCLLHPGGLSEDIIAIGPPVSLLECVVFLDKLKPWWYFKGSSLTAFPNGA